MATVNYPLTPLFVPQSIRNMNNTQVRNYCRKALYQLSWNGTKESCDLAGGIVKRVDIKDALGGKWLSSSSWINICASKGYGNLPDVIIIDLNGNVKILKYVPLSSLDIIKNILDSAAKAIEVIGIAKVIEDIASNISPIEDKIKRGIDSFVDLEIKVDSSNQNKLPAVSGEINYKLIAVVTLILFVVLGMDTGSGR